MAATHIVTCFDVNIGNCTSHFAESNQEAFEIAKRLHDNGNRDVYTSEIVTRNYRKPQDSRYVSNGNSQYDSGYGQR